MHTATFLKSLPGFTGDARLYRCEPPMPGPDGKSYEHIVVSAAVAYSGPETYIFGSDADGEITDWCELDGSFRGELDHAEALERAGYSMR